MNPQENGLKIFNCTFKVLKKPEEGKALQESPNVSRTNSIAENARFFCVEHFIKELVTSTRFTCKTLQFFAFLKKFTNNQYTICFEQMPNSKQKSD